MKGMVMLHVGVVLALSVTASAQSSLAHGYYIGRRVSLPDSLVETRADGRFRIAVVRVAPDSGSRVALAIAESVFPDPKEIQRAAAEEKLPLVRARLERAAALPGDRWWWDDYDAVLTPYAITGTAVDYYLRRMRARSDSSNPFTAFSEGRPHKGRFSYYATVSSAPEGGPAAGGYVVRMKLDWYYWCGMLCAVRFSVTREVFVSRDGHVIEVRGDARPALIVS